MKMRGSLKFLTTTLALVGTTFGHISKRANSLQEKRDVLLHKRDVLSSDQNSALNIWIPVFLQLSENVINTAGSTLECGLCQTSLLVVQEIIDIFGEDFVLDVAKDICLLIEKEEEVCDGVVPTMGPVIVKAVKEADNLIGYTGEFMCNSLLSTCSDFKPREITFDYVSPSSSAVDLNLTISRTTSCNSTSYSSTSNSTEYLTVLHISDLHYDPEYLEGSEADCSFPLCCEARTQSSSNVSEPAGRYGSYPCDSPMSLIESFGENLVSVIGKAPDLTLFTGDVGPHNVWYDNETSVKEAFTAYGVLTKYITNPLLATFGNHDISPVNFVETDAVLDGEEFPNEWAFETIGGYLSSWLPETTVSQFEQTRGKYSVRPTPGLKVINLNTVECYTDNFYVFYNIESDLDPNGQLQWLISELADSKAKGESVWLMAHVAPGDPDCNTVWSNMFNDIVNKYASTIKAQFYGHGHTDNFRVNYDSEGTASSVQYWGPSITTYIGLNAGYRVYKIHPETFEVMDSLTYYADISATSDSSEPEWKLEYSAREYLPSWPSDAPLNATFWDKVIDAFENDNTVFEKYAVYYYKSSSVYTPCHTVSCKEEFITNLKAGNSLNKYYAPIIDIGGDQNLTYAASSLAAAAGFNTTDYSYRKRSCIH